jgi:DUF1365 family protein
MTATTELPPFPAIVTGCVVHRREQPVRHAFRHRVYQWLIDLDDPPRLPRILRPLATFDPSDHLGDDGNGAGGDIKSGLRRFLAGEGVELGPDARVLMLANARVLGHVFNPLTVFWCFAADTDLRCVVAEVHNTYGERHAYVLRPDSDGNAEADKRFYVSPFNDVSGTYALRFGLSADRVRVEVRLRCEGQQVFEASFEGTPQPLTSRSLLRTVARHPAMPHRVSALIRAHGVWLWLRRLPVVARPHHRPQEGL